MASMSKAIALIRPMRSLSFEQAGAAAFEAARIALVAGAALALILAAPALPL